MADGLYDVTSRGEQRAIVRSDRDREGGLRLVETRRGEDNSWDGLLCTLEVQISEATARKD